MNKVFITGHNGLLGSAIHRQLKKKKNLKVLVEEKKKLNLENYKS